MDQPSNNVVCKASTKLNIPKYVKDIEVFVADKLKLIKKTSSEVLLSQQLYHDEVLKVYQEAFIKLISKTITYANLLIDIRNAYDTAIQVRNERITQFVTQDKVFGITARKNEQEEKVNNIMKENVKLKEQNLKMNLEISKMRKDMGKLQDEKFSDYIMLMKERDVRYTLYFENLGLHLKLKELDGTGQSVDEVYGDPVVLRIALDRCRDQLSTTQRDLKRIVEEYAETVPSKNYDVLESKYYDVIKSFEEMKVEHQVLEEKHKKLVVLKKSLEEERSELKERCSEMERAGTPRPQWELCADFIGGGRERWRQLARGLSSRDKLQALLKELGPAAETDILEHFEGLGLDPVIPPYLRYEGKVRNLRLSRREIAVIINDIWVGKLNDGRGMTMQDYVTKYFEDRYQQATVRAEWAYNLCSGAEQMLDEPHVKLFWGVLLGHLGEDVYTAHRDHWYRLRDNLYSKKRENITIEEFEKISKSTFPQKSEVDIKNMTDAVRRQLKLKMNSDEVDLDELFRETEEGFDRLELARELYRQRRLAQDKYIREVLAELGGKHAAGKPVTVDNLKRAFAIVDPAIDHIRMEKYVRWAFSDRVSELHLLGPLPLRAVAARLAAGNLERAGPRARHPVRRHYR